MRLPLGRNEQAHTSLSSERPSCKRSSDSRPFLTSLLPYLVLSYFLHRGYQLRNLDADHRSLSRAALDVQIKIRPVKHAQPLAHVAQPDSLDVHMRHLLFRDAHAIVFDLNSQPPVAARRSQLDFSST